MNSQIDDLEIEIKRVQLQREQLALKREVADAARRAKGADVLHSVVATTREVGGAAAEKTCEAGRAAAPVVKRTLKGMGIGLAVAVVGLVFVSLYKPPPGPMLPRSGSQTGQAPVTR